MRIFATSKPVAGVAPADLAPEMDAEIEKGKQLYREGLIVQAYMDPEYSRTFMILEAASIAAATARLDEYPHVRQGLISFELTPLVGLPAVSMVHRDRGEALPVWWPTEER